MNTKLTLRLDDRLIKRAKRYSDESGKSLSRLVGDFFSLIDSEEADTEITPRVRSLLGSLAGSDVDERDFHEHLEEKHR
ncbi:MAG: antitoxin [Actinobacteria bacterium HGW-Actinobacteria-10]|nr:MAG: antitoxin [Actinobacteria bacterium HGW-Actinobacteria-10]